MRTKLAIVAVILGLVTLISGPGFVDAQPADPFVLNVTKVVDGTGFAGPYGVSVTCGGTEVAAFGISDGQTVTVGDPIAFNDVCIVTEEEVPGVGGRDAVIYACEATVDTTCVNDQTVAFDVSDAGGVGSITITNTFFGHGICEECGLEPPPGAVAAQPAFTG